MVSTDLKSLRQRLEALGIRQSTFAAFARCHDGDVSRVIKGFHVASAPVERMAEAIAALEDLAAADSEVKIDMSSIQNIRAAQKRLAEKRNAPATAPWQFRGATASPEDCAGVVSIARETLAGASKE